MAGARQPRGRAGRVVSWGMVVAATPPAVGLALQRFAAALRERFGDRVSAIVLFGSHARGEAHEESDVDVLVAIDELTPREQHGVFDLAYDVDRSLEDWVVRSALAYSTAQAARMRADGRRLWRDIDREGVLL